MKSVTTLIVVYIGGLMWCYTSATFGRPFDDLIYHLWVKFTDLMVWVSFYNILKGETRNLVRWLMLFSAIRFLWEPVSYFTGLSVNNQWAVAALFLALIGVISYLSFREFKKISKYL